MNLLHKALEWFGVKGITGRGPGDPASGSIIGRDDGLSAWGGPVGVAAAMQVVAFRACVKKYADLISSLPIEVHEGSEVGFSQAVQNHDVARLLNDAPNAEQTSVDFWQSIVFDLEVFQNAYIELHRIGGRVVALDVLPFSNVSVRRLSDRSLRYSGSYEGRSFDLGERDIIHVRGFGGAPLGAPTTLDHGRMVLGLARQIDESALAFFRNGMRPSGALSVTPALTADQREVAEKGLVEKFMGAMNAGRPILLDNGTKWDPLSSNMEDSEAVAMRAAVVEAVCQLMDMPPFMIGHTEKQTSFGTGVTEQTQGFYKFALAPRLRRLEKAFGRPLIVQGRRQFLRFQMDDLLRPDPKTRAEISEIEARNGALTVDEWRGWEGRGPTPGGNVSRVQMQNVPLTEAMGQQAEKPSKQEGEDADL